MPQPSRHASERVSPALPTSAVRLLEARAGRTTTELLRLAAARVCHDERAVVGHQDVLDLLLGGLVYVLLVVGHDALGNRLTERVDLRGVAAALNAQADVDLLPAVGAQDQQRL